MTDDLAVLQAASRLSEYRFGRTRQTAAIQDICRDALQEATNPRVLAYLYESYASAVCNAHDIVVDLDDLCGFRYTPEWHFKD